MKKKKPIVFVGISGGVDSAVSAALLQKQVYEVVGVFIKTWHPDFIECNEENELHDSMRVAAHLNIPFLTFDFADVYKKEVADYMISEYRAGRTPNPDVMCNKEIKFGAFLKKAISLGADYVATGHYAIKLDCPEFFSGPRVAPMKSDGLNQTSSKDSGQSRLVKGIDPLKDQSYFLWTLQQEQLKRILFPVGHLKKTEVRRLAKKFHLPVAEKKDSQGICFLGDIDLKEFLKHYIKPKKGKVLLAPQEAGSEVEGKRKDNVIGYHDGAVFHTLGERHGFTITKKSPNDGPYYIVGKDVKKNILFVSQSKDKNPLKKSTDIFLLKNSSCSRQSRSQVSFEENFCLCLKDVNWISESYPLEAKSYVCQIRYHGEFLSCKIKAEGSERSRRIKIIFTKPVLVASGQSCVLYDGDVCLGGGVVR